MGDPPDRRRGWTPYPRPEWVARVNEEGRILGARSLVPLDAGSLLAQAVANTGLEDFGDDAWREPFGILLDAIEREAELNLIGRLFTRSDLLIHLEGRLRVIDWYARHPELGRNHTYPGAPYRFEKSPWRISRRAPLLGEHA